MTLEKGREPLYSLGWTTFLTGTDTAGANYNVAAGTASIVGVNSTPASVTAALGAISNGTLAGLVPGLVQINAVAAAQAAVTAFEKATATSTLATTTVPTLDTNKDGSVTLTELNTAAVATKTAHDLLTGGDSTVVASAKLTDLTTALAAAKAAAVAANNATLVGNLDTALATQATVKGTAADVTATAAAKASAQAGFTTAIGGSTTVSFATLDSKTLAAGDITDTASLYTALTAGIISGAERTALVTEVNKLGAFGTALVAAADKEVAVAKADAAVTAATTATGVTGAAYVTAGNTQKAQADVVTKATASDVTAAAIKVAIDAHTALDTTSTAAATTALTQFQAANVAKVTLTDISAKTVVDTVNGDATKADVFYFAAKAPSAADVTIGTFGAGDVVVVGSGYTFNSGALSTGNNSAAEMFLVQGANGVQIVLENSVFGSATATTGANGVVAASPTDGVSVITLTGVTIDHVSVANGVVSYV